MNGCALLGIWFEKLRFHPSVLDYAEIIDESTVSFNAQRNNRLAR